MEERSDEERKTNIKKTVLFAITRTKTQLIIIIKYDGNNIMMWESFSSA